MLSEIKPLINCCNKSPDPLLEVHHELESKHVTAITVTVNLISQITISSNLYLLEEKDVL